MQFPALKHLFFPQRLLYTCPQTYWSVDDVARKGLAAPFSGSDNDAVAELDVLLRQAISGQMVADVPLGAFLSGGVHRRAPSGSRVSGLS